MFEITRPLVSLDLETTGINPKEDRIIEIGIVKIHLNGERKKWSTYVNPGRPIPKEASDATRRESLPDGITDEVVKNAPTFVSFAMVFANGLKECDFVGYNVRSFDLPLLSNEFKRCGIGMDFRTAKVIDAFKLYQKLRPRNLDAYVEDYLGRKRTESHGALPDAEETLEALEAQITKHGLPWSPDKLHDLIFGDQGDMIAGGSFYWFDGEVYINFGKHKKVKLKNVPRNYLSWVSQNEGFEPEIKKVCQDAMQGKYPERKKDDTSREERVEASVGSDDGGSDM